MNLTSKYLVPLLAVFLIIFGFIFLGDTFFQRYNIDRNILLVANGLFFLTSIVAFAMQKKALRNANPHVFVRSVMGSMMLKMFICVAAVAVYAIAAGDKMSKATVFLSLFFYLLYLTAEVISILKLNKRHA